MDAILLCMKKRGIRFFRKIRFPNTDVARFHTKYGFLKTLYSRKSEKDNVLIMAHGSSGSILTTTGDLNRPFIPYITCSDARAFQNDFVFAVSCLTANVFGKCCVDHGAIAYLGYQVEFGSMFSSTSLSIIPKRIARPIDTAIKHIFITTLSETYEKFLMEPITVKVFRELFAFTLEKRLTHLSSLTMEQFCNQYHTRLTKRDYDKYIVSTVLRVLSFLNEVLPRLVCIGDENYISSTYLKYVHDGSSEDAESVVVL